VERRYTILWVSVFITLLVLNVIVIIGRDVDRRAGESTPPDEDVLLEGIDEVTLGWWPERAKRRETGIPEPGNENPASRKPVMNIPDGNVAESKDYPELMNEYIYELRSYLAVYFRITSMVNGFGKDNE